MLIRLAGRALRPEIIFFAPALKNQAIIDIACK
jgi:hypothetical protein